MMDRLSDLTPEMQAQILALIASTHAKVDPLIGETVQTVEISEYPSVIVCEPYPVCPEQDCLWYWAAHRDNGETGSRYVVTRELLAKLPEHRGYYLYGHEDDESPDYFETLDEALDALWRHGPPTVEIDLADDSLVRICC